MPLDEAQIVRFSRQILLRAVGGKGQQALLAAKVRAAGDGAAIATACAYLAAGGSQVDAASVVTTSGFPSAPSPVPDAPSEALLLGLDEPLPEGAELHETVVVVTKDAFVAAPAGGCPDCVRENVAALATDRTASSEEEAPAPDLIGALAALSLQRFVLGLEKGLQRIRVAPDGTIQPLDPVRCEAHR